jgi:hypothetical protein
MTMMVPFQNVARRTQRWRRNEAGSLRFLRGLPAKSQLPANATVVLLLLPMLAANAGVAPPVELSRQVITLPANAGEPLFADVEGNGRCNLLVIDTAERRLLNYRQRPNGFTNSPDQTIPLPPQTAWVAPCDVDAHPGLELLMSAAAGLY